MIFALKKTGCNFSFFTKTRIASCFLFISLFFISLPPIFSAESDYTDYSEKAERLIKKAEALNLHKDSYWRTLLHYKPAVFSRYKSLVDDPKFFCAKKGKTNPKAELEATIRAFFEPAPNPGAKEKHAIERFPGRYKWLCEKLELSEADFPYNGDLAFQNILRQVNPGNVFLVFPSIYLKRPASVFGHTFLLIETKDKPRLTANSINYGAVTKVTGGPLYAILGLTGGFKGYYGFETYYEKIKQYSDMDMRDMWEFKLNFTDEEKENMLRHAFDLAGIYSKYFFVSENCSYNLLFLIEAARPSTRATDKLFGVVEPLATVKLADSLGLTDETKYRPSAYSKVENGKNNLSLKQQKYIKDVCYGKKTVQDFPFSDLPAEKQAEIWNTASDYLSSLLNNRKITSDEYRSRFVSVLSARRKLGKIEDTNIKTPEDPKKAHGSKKIALTGGNDINGGYCGMEFRLCSHEQLERPAGYSENSELTFANVEVRFNLVKNLFYLNKATLLSILSLPASDTFFLNGASQILTGLAQNPNSSENSDLAWRLKFLYGASVKPASWLQIYLMGGADSYFSPAYSYGTDLLLGGDAGIIAGAGPWRNKISATIMQSPFDIEHFRTQFAADTCIFLSQNMALKGSYFFNMDYGKFRHECSFSVNAYF